LQLQELKNGQICVFTNVRQGEKSVKITMKKVIDIDMQGKITKSKIYEVRTW